MFFRFAPQNIWAITGARTIVFLTLTYVNIVYHVTIIMI